ASGGNRGPRRGARSRGRGGTPPCRGGGGRDREKGPDPSASIVQSLPLVDAPPVDSSVLAYPTEIERRFVEGARARAPRSSENECIDRLVPAASRLSDLFTVARPDEFPDYAADAEARLAYGLLFFPQTWARVRFALAEAVEARAWRPRGETAA